MAAAGRTRLSDIKLQRCAFDMPLRSICILSIATVPIGVRLVVLVTIQIGIRPRVAAIYSGKTSKAGYRTDWHKA